MTEETVLYSDYAVQRTRASRLGIKQDIKSREGFICPRCECPNPEIEHENHAQCIGCEMHFRRYGNGLHCSDSFIPKHPVGRDVAALRALVDQTQKPGLAARIIEWFKEETP